MPAWAWPISVCGTVLIIVVFLAFRFPSQVGDLISRITKVGATGVHAKPPTPVIGQEPTDLAVKSGAAVEEQLKVFDNLFLISREQYFKETLLKDVVTPADREKILLRHLSYVVLVSGFESTYNTIWGSQLSALQSANESGARGVPVETLRAWYEWGKARYPDRYTNYAF